MGLRGIQRAATTIAIVALATACSTAATDDTTSTTSGVDPFAAQPLPDASILGTEVGSFVLPDASDDDTPFAIRADDDQLLLVYFGFTTCPDVCPTTLADVRTAFGGLEDDADMVDFAMITIDPDRDSGDLLTQYVQFYVDGAHALRTDDEDALRSVADAFDVSYDVVTLADGTIEVQHSGYLYAVDDAGIIRTSWAFGAEPEAIAGELVALLRS